MEKQTINVLVMGQVIHGYNHKLMIKNTKEYISKVFAIEHELGNIDFDKANIHIDSSVSVPYGNQIKVDKLQNGVYDLLITGAVPHKLKGFAGSIEYIHPNVGTCTRSKGAHQNISIKPINKSNLLGAVIQSMSKFLGYQIDPRNYSKTNSYETKIHQNWEFEDMSY